MKTQKWEQTRPNGMEYRYSTENGKDILEVKNQTWIAPRWTREAERQERRRRIAVWRANARKAGWIS